MDVDDVERLRALRDRARDRLAAAGELPPELSDEQVARLLIILRSSTE